MDESFFNFFVYMDGHGNLIQICQLIGGGGGGLNKRGRVENTLKIKRGWGIASVITGFTGANSA